LANAVIFCVMVIEIDKREWDRVEELIRQQTERIEQLEEEVQRLKKLLEGKADAKAAKKPKFTENYSLDRNKRNKQKKKRKKSTGRRTNEAKRDLATLQVDVYHDDATREDCIRHRSQLVWRMIDGKAVYVCYHIYDLPDSRDLPLPPTVRNSRCEFGMEIILIVAFLHFWIGVSLDNACQVMEFFTGLRLPKSQADSLLNQLSKDWNEQYDTIAELIALQMIVYIDETGWKVGKKSCYTWVFSTAMHVLFRCGVTRKMEEATAVLGESFAGIGVTDDYAAYKSLFSQHQLCWAHLIRKAIKLALQNPDKTEYADFLDQLCGVYDDAKCSRMDGRLGVRREEKSRELQARVQSLCTRSEDTIVQDVTSGHEETFILLQRELVNNLDCLFVFVKHPDVEPTNNRSERNVRREAEIRKGARTSKSALGAHRRSVIVTVLASLQTRIANFTLSNLLGEVHQWLENKCSIFELELQHQQDPHAPPAAANG
jgi:transposase